MDYIFVIAWHHFGGKIIDSNPKTKSQKRRAHDWKNQNAS
jgi:hypothetical protein